MRNLVLSLGLVSLLIAPLSASADNSTKPAIAHALRHDHGHHARPHAHMVTTHHQRASHGVYKPAN